LAKRLGRSEYSVKAALKRLMLSARINDGYSRTDLAELLGASPASVRRWERRGWLAFGCYGRASEASVRRFVKMHPDQYQLSFVDEAWFKGLLFDAYNSPTPGHRESNLSKTSEDEISSYSDHGMPAENNGRHITIREHTNMAAFTPSTANAYRETT
jgi:hypothetical protein